MKLTTKQMTFATLFAVLTYLAGLITVPVGPVPVTLQTLMVLLTGILLPKTEALLAMLMHLLLKLLLGSFQLAVSPSFGFLVGFILAAYLTAWYYEGHKEDRGSLLIALSIGAIVPYIIGLPYMAYILNVVGGAGMSFMTIMQVGFLIFIPGDLIKLAGAYLIAKRLMPVTHKLLQGTV